MRLPRLRLIFGLVSALLACGAGATPFEDRVEVLFREPLAEQMALAPDGRRLAYTTQIGNDLAVIIANVDWPAPNVTLLVDEARSVAFSKEKERAQLRFLRWATSDRLVFSLTEDVIDLPGGGTQRYAPIMAVDADGKNPKTLLDAGDFTYDSSPAGPPPPTEAVPDILAPPRRTSWRTPTLKIIGFLPRDRDQLIVKVSSTGPASGPAQFALNIRTGKYKSFMEDWPLPDPTVVYDDYTLSLLGYHDHNLRTATKWIDEEFSGMQRELERKFPRRVVEIIDWSQDRARALVRVTGGSDPGRVFIFLRAENLIAEVFRRAPWLNAVNLNDTRSFAFDSAQGVHLTGYLTWPNHPKLKPPPLIVFFPTGFPGNEQSAYDPEAQVMADLGFVVLRLNHRSVGGVRGRDIAPLRDHLDQVAADDARAAIEWLAGDHAAHPFDRRRIAALGRGFGGYLAVRALELYPDVFRCGIAFDAPMDPQRWLFPGYFFADSLPGAGVPVSLLWPNDFKSQSPGSPQWNSFSAIAHAKDLTGALFLLAEPSRNQAVDQGIISLRSKLKGFGHPADYLDLDPSFNLSAPKARAATYLKIDEFFNLRLYDYGVKVGPSKEVK